MYTACTRRELYIYSHKLPSCKTSPVERPRDTTAISLLLWKQHSSVSVLVVARGATVDFRPPPVLCRMVIASPGSFASLGCTTASGETCSNWSHTQFIALKLSLTAWHAHGPYTACELCMPKGPGCWRLEAQISTNCNHAAFFFPEKTVLWVITSSAHWFNYGSNAEPTAIGH